MIIIYEREIDGIWKFLRLEFNSGEFENVTVLNDFIASVYILIYKELGYTFIHR